MRTSSTSQVIEDFIAAAAGDTDDRRQVYLYRQLLYSLVRQAKSEHLMEIRASVARMTGMAPLALRAKSAKPGRPRDLAFDARQQRFEFDRSDKPV